MSVDPSRISHLLETGLDALKREDYSGAILSLEQLLQLPEAVDNPNTPDCIKAQMGLMAAYRQTGQLDLARHLGQQLMAHDSIRVKAWAERQMADLEPQETTDRPDRASQEPPSDATGFSPIAPQSNEPSGERRRVVLPAAGVPEASIERPTPMADRAQPPEASQADVSASIDTFPETPTADAGDRFDPNGGDQRAQKWAMLPKLAPVWLQLAQVSTAIGLVLIAWGFWGAKYLLDLFWTTVSIQVLRQGHLLPTLEVPWIGLIVGFAVLYFAAPWILEWILARFHGLKPLPTATLARYSPESHRLLQRTCQQQRLALPKLGVLPIAAPVVLTYGFAAKNARMVVSQGLLDRLSDDEIATLYAAELGHILNQNMAALSWVTVCLQLPYLIYWQGAALGDRLLTIAQQVSSQKPWLGAVFRLPAYLLALVSSLAYGVFWCFRWAGLWLARVRVRYDDRIACNLTGNPNGLARAIVKLATETANVVEQEQAVDPLLEGFGLLTPLDYRIAIPWGSVLKAEASSALLVWDYRHPLRRWLMLGHGPALLGERLQALMAYAQTWELSPLLRLPRESARPASKPSNLLRLAAPWWGGLFGWAIAVMFWLVSWVLFLLGQPQMAWMGSDYGLFLGLPFIGLAIGIILRFNALFPEIPRSLLRTGATSPQPEPFPLPSFLMDPGRDLLNPQPVNLQGQLLGRSGISNWLGQDLWIKTDRGLLRLQYLSQLGVLGNWARDRLRPCHHIGESVTVVGWLRRGATAWVDLDNLRMAAGTNQGGHQIWSTVLATIAFVVGLVLIL